MICLQKSAQTCGEEGKARSEAVQGRAGLGAVLGVRRKEKPLSPGSALPAGPRAAAGDVTTQNTKQNSLWQGLAPNASPAAPLSPRLPEGDSQRFVTDWKKPSKVPEQRGLMLLLPQSPEIIQPHLEKGQAGEL